MYLLKNNGKPSKNCTRNISRRSSVAWLVQHQMVMPEEESSFCKMHSANHLLIFNLYPLNAASFWLQCASSVRMIHMLSRKCQIKTSFTMWKTEKCPVVFFKGNYLWHILYEFISTAADRWQCSSFKTWFVPNWHQKRQPPELQEFREGSVTESAVFD